jgi:uncharacterized membrane protein YphA (DoxX/SURF4 family)
MLNTLTVRAKALDEKMSGLVIGGVRILAGLLWLANIHWKVPPKFGEGTGGGLYKYSESVTRHSPFAPFTWVTEHIILPNFQLFGWMTLILETLLAMLLLAGYRTKLVALAGAGMSAAIMLSVVYYDKTYEWSWSYLLMIGLHLLIFATAAGKHVGVDGIADRSPAMARRSLGNVGVLAVIIGVVGLYVARSVNFAGRKAALLGSDAGFVANGKLERRWELKFVWFNPLWAVLTIVLGALLVVGVVRVRAALAGAAGFAVIAVVVFLTQTFDYLRDDGAVQKVSTGSNAAMWGALAIAGGLLARRAGAAGATTE